MRANVLLQTINLMSYYSIMNTTYYHLRYNVYEDAGAPVEKETWIKFEHQADESEIREHLATKHLDKVSIIFSKEIDIEEFEQFHSATTLP